MSSSTTAQSNGANGTLDVYARPFIPEFLLTISRTQAPHVYPLRRHSFDIDFKKYIRSFAGTDFLSPTLFMPNNLGQLQSNGTSTEDLNISNYQEFFGFWLRTELEALKTAQGQYDRFKVPIYFTKTDHPSEVVLTAKLTIPGLAENSPFVRLGDIVHLRPLFLDPKHRPLTHIQNYSYGAFVNTQLFLEGWYGDVFYAEVTMIIRARESIDIKMSFIPEVFHLVQHRLNTFLFNIQFPIRDSLTSSLWGAIRTASAHLTSRGHSDLSVAINGHQTSPAKCWLGKMLFPDTSDGKQQTTLNSLHFSFKPFDNQLNYEQCRAVDSVLLQNYGTVPFLIHGPPGTGKTKTVVETALQLLHKGVARHILVCAPSDPAADTLTQRLKGSLPLNEILRLNSPSRTFAEVADELLSFCYVDGDRFGIPPFKMMMKYKVVVITCRDTDLLIQARLTNHDLFDFKVSMLSALEEREDRLATPLSLHWQALLIDEAAQATEPEALIPLTVVSAPTAETDKLKAPIFVMAGDQQQLGPRTASQNSVIQTSLFERLLNRPLYAEHPLARHRLRAGASAARPLTKSMLPIIRPPFSNLLRNYRSHPAILAVPNALFYYDTLLPEATNTDSILHWTGWKGPWPVLFSHNAGPDEIEHDGGGWYNLSEVEKVCGYASSLLESGLINQEDICVMSPFSAQVQRLRVKFRSMGLRDVNIGPMEAFQGLESRVVILCTTRSRTRFLDQDKARGLGIINERKRFNVAITRAKHGLILIGTQEALLIDPCWRAFLDFCIRNDLYEGELNLQLATSAHQAPTPILETILKLRASKPEPALLGITGELKDDMWNRGVTDASPDNESVDEVNDEEDFGSEEEDDGESRDELDIEKTIFNQD
jgi:hypothetical protein